MTAVELSEELTRTVPKGWIVEAIFDSPGYASIRLVRPDRHTIGYLIPDPLSKEYATIFLENVRDKIKNIGKIADSPYSKVRPDTEGI